MRYPCKDCEERLPHCHSGCDKYGKVKAEGEAMIAARIKERADGQYHRDKMTKLYTRKLKDGR